MSEVIHTTTPATLVRDVERPVVLLVPAEGRELLEVPKLEQLQEPAQYNQLHEVLEQLVILEKSEQGPPGPPGQPGPAGGQVVRRNYGETISALRVVYELDGLVYALDPTDDTQALLVLGITTTAGAAGSIGTVQAFGPLDDAGWSWTPGLVFAGANGTLTQTVPTSGAEIVIGFAPSATRLHIQFNPPVFEE